MPEEFVVVEQCAADDDSWRNNPDVQPKPKPVSTRIAKIVEDGAAQIRAAEEAGLIEVPDGLFLQIAGLRAQLNELATLVSPSRYALEALPLIDGMGVLPDPLEQFRQSILAELNAEINPE